MPIHRLTIRRKHAPKFGFTIIELMMAIAIMAILVGIGAPSLRDFVIRNRISSQASDLVGDLQLARSESNRRGLRVAVCKANSSLSGCTTGADWSSGWIVYIDSNRDALYTNGEEILRVHQALPTNITMTVTPGSTPAGDRTYYRPTGPADADHTFTVCQTGYSGRVVTLLASGRTSVAATAAVC